jgi:WS/DGAT/MGAT family acyltransferase
MLMLGVLEREIPFDSVLEELTAAGEEVPRFKDFLRRAPLDIAPPMWIPKDGFEVRAQINQASLPPGATWDDALTIVDRFQRSDFPTAAPPWEILLINGLPTGRSLLAMKVHHALSDGTALAMLFAKAFGGDFLAKSGMQVVAKMERRPETSPLVIALADRATAVRVWARRAARALPRLLGDRSVRRRERDAIRRHVRPRHRIPPGSHGPTRRLSGFRVSADVWSEAARNRGGSANDLYLAVVAHAVRRHFVDWDLDAMPLQIVMPVNIRESTGVQDGGNVTGVGVVELAGRPEDVLDLSEVRSRTRHVKEQAGKERPSVIDELVRLLPGRLRALIDFREFATRDIVATNVPMPIPGELCGVPFEMMFMVAPAIGASVSFSLTSYGDHLYLAVNADVEVAQEPLDECLSATLNEVFGESVQSLRAGGAAMGSNRVSV